MASPAKTVAAFDAPTRALWRAAENGAIEQLEAILPRVTDINARNQHGVTALMRAAQNGHAPMVRALLENGAAANIKRDDKFTALSLAAFFGHTEVVRVLMEHGADSHASTRGGTSPQMWATARTYKEIANQLEKPLPPRRQVAVVKPAALSEPKAQPPRAEPLVVRTLKDPPEIWDLVQEQPRGFDARAAFMTRLKAVKKGFAFRVATAMVVIAMGVIGVLVLREAQARNESRIEPQPIASQPKVTPPRVAPAPVPNETPVAAPQTAPPIAGSDKPWAIRKFSSTSHAFAQPQFERSATNVAPEITETAPPAAAPAERPAPPVRVETTSKPKTNVPLSPQLIAPAKTSTPKAKVIQWP